MADTQSKGQVLDVGTVAKLLMLSERRVQQLAQSKWIPKPYTLVGSVQGYLRFLQDEQRKATKSAGDAEVRRERARKLKLDNDENEGFLVRTEDAIAALDAIVGPIKSELAGVAPRVTDDVAMRRRIDDAIDDALSGLADRCQKSSDDLRSGRDALAADTEGDADGMGEEEPEISGVGGATGTA